MYSKQKNKITIIVTSVLTLLIFGVVACVKKKNEIMGYAPIYGNPSEMHKIESQGVQPIVNGGKIYAFQNYTFQVEAGKGVHIIQNNSLTDANKIDFINIPGCTNIAVKNNILYADNYTDLIGIDINNIHSVAVISRIENTFQAVSQQVPPYEGVFFECVDANKGAVIGWTEKLLINPKCRK